jgi:hypothetical protein
MKPLFEDIDKTERPLTPKVCKLLAQAFHADVAFLLIMRRARNLCWLEWHAPQREMFDRCEAQLGYKVLQSAITIGITKTVSERIVH